jgi:Flp pilus assembly protein TadG
MGDIMHETNSGAGPNVRHGRVVDRRGAAAVEFAMTVPILFLLLFSAVEISRMNMVWQSANNAAYEAARSCVVPGATATEGRNAGLAVLQNCGVSGGSVTISPSTILNDTPDVTATVSIPFNSNTWIKPFYSKNKSVQVTCKMARDWTVSTRQN